MLGKEVKHCKGRQDENRWDRRRWEEKRQDRIGGEQNRPAYKRAKGIALVAVLTFSLSIVPFPSCLRFSLTNSPVIYEQEPSWRWGSAASVHMHFCKHTQTHHSSAQTHTDVLLKHTQKHKHTLIIYFISYASVVFIKWLFRSGQLQLPSLAFDDKLKISFNQEHTHLMHQSVRVARCRQI